VYLHVGYSSPWLPTFTRPDGTPVGFTLASTGLPVHSLRADLDVDDGIVMIRYAAHAGTDRQLVIDPTQRPYARIARHVTYLKYDVEVDTNAALLVVEDVEGRYDISDPTLLAERTPFRVTALYADGSSEDVVALDVVDTTEPSRQPSRWPAFMVAFLALCIASIATRMLTTTRQ
jgi:hypothetical protein